MTRFLWGVVTGILLVGFTLVILAFAFMRFSLRPPAVADPSTLILRLGEDIPERAAISVPLPWFEERAAPTISDIWELLHKAELDTRIKAVIIMPQGVNAGWGKLDEIHQLLTRVRRAGKLVVAFLRSPSSRDYYLATAADHIYMPPEDVLDLKGLRAELIYLRKMLDKFGVQVEVEHAGKYKDFGDMFTRTSMSPETRLVLNSILDDLYTRLVDTVSAGRKKSPSEVRAILDEGPFLAKQAVARGLVDALLYEDQMFEELKKRLPGKQLNKLFLRDYMRVPAVSVGFGGKRKIALLVAEGYITGGSGDFCQDSAICAGDFTGLLRKVGDDESLRGVIVRIDSPGGSSFASDEIWRAMNLLNKKKPLVISMSDTAASGGYYMAMTGDPIVAYPATLTGSIGVLYGKINLHGLYDKLGIQKQVLTRGRFANIDSDYEPLSAPARAKLREGIEDNYRAFVERVAKARRKNYEEIEPLAQGRVWLGDQAKNIGLIDELGGLDRAIELLKHKAGIPAAERVTVVVYPPKISIFEHLFRRYTENFAGRRLLRALFGEIRAEAWAEGGLMKLMPCAISVR